MNDEQYLERKKHALNELKQFARAEMARDLATRHGKSLKLPWDSEEAPVAAQSQTQPELDSEALDALAGLAGGN